MKHTRYSLLLVCCGLIVSCKQTVQIDPDLIRYARVKHFEQTLIPEVARLDSFNISNVHYLLSDFLNQSSECESKPFTPRYQILLAYHDGNYDVIIAADKVFSYRGKMYRMQRSLENYYK
ncbi:MAG TPA: hypothetical protein VF629_14890 [Hymenobacter sp.]|jgi:hypothetical protein|uniref:hypothetical protein n=1 Tax=Hymenobacter sp. TaxID=1898978 RepID=UPI002ED80640